MVDFFKRNKLFIIVITLTCALVFGGVFLMGGRIPSQTSSNVVSSEILVPKNSFQTSGFVDNKYLAASPSAVVTLVEFGDYQCPACGLYEPYVKKILTDFPGKVTYVFRNYPLPQHKNAPISSYAVEAAGIQGKYWEMHEKMFTTQADWSSVIDPTEMYKGHASELGLNIDQFVSDMDSQKVKDIVKADMNDGNTVRLSETPTFYLNGKKVNLTGDFSSLENLIKSELSK